MKSIRATNKQVESTKVVILSSFKDSFSYENFMQTFKDKWFYTFPYLVLWNFSNLNCISLPGEVKKKYMFIISGYSFNQIYNVLYSNRNKTSFQNITSILKKDRYTPFTNFLDFYLDFKFVLSDKYLPIY
jgi:rRNA maturation protein Rpf1